MKLALSIFSVLIISACGPEPFFTTTEKELQTCYHSSALSGQEDSKEKCDRILARIREHKSWMHDEPSQSCKEAFEALQLHCAVKMYPKIKELCSRSHFGICFEGDSEIRSCVRSKQRELESTCGHKITVF